MIKESETYSNKLLIIINQLTQYSMDRHTFRHRPHAPYLTLFIIIHRELQFQDSNQLFHLINQQVFFK